jgi:hypothetical protein
VPLQRISSCCWLLVFVVYCSSVWNRATEMLSLRPKGWVICHCIGWTFSGRPKQYLKKGKSNLLSSKPGWRAAENFQRENSAHVAITITSDNLLARGFSRCLWNRREGRRKFYPPPLSISGDFSCAPLRFISTSLAPERLDGYHSYSVFSTLSILVATRWTWIFQLQKYGSLR